MGIVVAAMSSIFTNLNHESKAMSEKLGAMDLEKVLISSLDGSACLYALTLPTPITFAANAPMSSGAPQTRQLPSSPANPARLYSSYDSATATPGPILTQVGQLASPYSNSLVVRSIALELTEISGATVKGRWRVDFDGTRLVRPVKPAYVSVTLTANISNPGAATFTSCQGSGGGGGAAGGSGEWCGAFLGHVGNSFTMEIFTVISRCQGVVPACAAGQTLQGPYCMGGPFVYGYTTSSACPSGYSIKETLTSTDPVTGNPTTLLTCMPN